MSKVKAIPDGYHSVTPMLIVKGAARAIEFYKLAFGAEEIDRAVDASGHKIMHAALRIGDSMLFVNDVFPEMGATPSQTSLWIYVTDCDASCKRATEAGAKATMPPTDMFWGDRMGALSDKWGNEWTLAQRIKEPTPEEMKAAQDAFVAKSKK